MTNGYNDSKEDNNVLKIQSFNLEQTKVTKIFANNPDMSDISVSKLEAISLLKSNFNLALKVDHISY